MTRTAEQIVAKFYQKPRTAAETLALIHGLGVRGRVLRKGKTWDVEYSLPGRDYPETIRATPDEHSI